MDEPTPVPEGYYPPEQQPESFEHRPHTSLPMIAGILLIIAALSGAFFWWFISATDISQVQNVLPSDSPFTIQQIQSILQSCSIIGFIFTALTFVGGIMAIRRKSWGLAIAGSILGLLTFGVLYSATICSLLGLTLLIISRKEFT